MGVCVCVKPDRTPTLDARLSTTKTRSTWTFRSVHVFRRDSFLPRRSGPFLGFFQYSPNRPPRIFSRALPNIFPGHFRSRNRPTRTVRYRSVQRKKKKKLTKFTGKCGKINSQGRIRVGCSGASQAPRYQLSQQPIAARVRKGENELSDWLLKTVLTLFRYRK